MIKNELRQHIRHYVLVIWAIIFLGLILAAMLANNGSGMTRSPPGVYLLLLAFLGSAIFSACILYSSLVQTWVLNSKSNVSSIKGELRFIMVFFSSLGLGFALDFAFVGVLA